MTANNAEPAPVPPLDVAGLIHRAECGEPAARDELFRALYQTLHRIARREATRYGQLASLGTTTLLHEAYLSLNQRDALAFTSESHFLAYAARAMRGLVIDHVRARNAAKRGGGLDITSFDTLAAEQCAGPEGLTTLSDALDELAQHEPTLAHVVDLKFFSGFTFADIAAMTGVSERTVQRQWEKARLLLQGALSPT